MAAMLHRSRPAVQRGRGSVRPWARGLAPGRRWSRSRRLQAASSTGRPGPWVAVAPWYRAGRRARPPLGRWWWAAGHWAADFAPERWRVAPGRQRARSGLLRRGLPPSAAARAGCVMPPGDGCRADGRGDDPGRPGRVLLQHRVGLHHHGQGQRIGCGAGHRIVIAHDRSPSPYRWRFQSRKRDPTVPFAARRMAIPRSYPCGG